jgi:hypothetical protein
MIRIHLKNWTKMTFARLWHSVSSISTRSPTLIFYTFMMESVPAVHFWLVWVETTARRRPATLQHNATYSWDLQVTPYSIIKASAQHTLRNRTVCYELVHKRFTLIILTGRCILARCVVGEIVTIWAFNELRHCKTTWNIDWKICSDML